MPPQRGDRPNEESIPQPAGQQPREAGQNGAVGPVDPRPSHRRLGVRLRSALAAAAVVAVALAVAAVTVVMIRQAMLTGRMDAAAVKRASEVAAALATGDDTRLGQAVRPVPGEQTVVQVIDAAGTVVVASPDVEGEPPV